MPTIPKRRTLPKPSVFRNASTDQWVCEYHEYDDKGQPRARRKSFVRDLKREGKEATLTEQRTAALAMRDELLKQQSEQKRKERREHEQTHLTPVQLREAKAAFAIFDQIQYRHKSLVDAVIQYRDSLERYEDTPQLADCVGIFLGRKQEAADAGRLSQRTFQTLQQRLQHMQRYFEAKQPNVKIGDIHSNHLIDYLDGLGVSQRTLRNYITDIGNFFHDASDERDKNRLLKENPMGGVVLHYRKHNHSSLLKPTSTTLKIPKILQLEQSQHALNIAYQDRKYGVLGFVVCGLLLGMRPSEVFDLTAEPDYWKRFVRLDEGVMRIEGFGKKRDQRAIVMPDNAKAWLTLIHDKGWPLCFKVNARGRNVRYMNFRARAYLPDKEAAERLIPLRRLHKQGKKLNEEEKAFMEECNTTLQEYEDVLRHTFGTNYYYDSGFDKNRTIEQMGHSSEVFVEHYRGLLNNTKDAEAYFALHPDKF